MRGSGEWRYRTILVLLILPFFSGCGLFRTENEISLCDLYQGDSCVEPMPDLRTYTISGMPESKKESWFALDHYIYFHSRQTPGIRVELARAAEGGEYDELERTLECRYRLIRGAQEVSGIMKGRRIDPDGAGFWCFDYLGSMLDRFHKEYGVSQSAPEPNFFPIELELSFDSAVRGVRGKKRIKINVEW